ncbi:receptor-like protein 9DC3 [Malus domestica]|uniref:receptor-like protein 9DC3 n=1 Tax=Malus domestica TaxID=3750 RepID=UPI00397487D8
MASNLLQGSLPIPPQSIVFYDVANNDFNGEISLLFCNMNLALLDLANNNLSGMLPQCLGNSSALERHFPALVKGTASVEGSHFGPVTNHEFPNLCIIDLSHNGFSDMLPFNYLENWNFMKFVNETNQTYFEVSSASPTEFIYSYQYKITIFSNGVELKYLKTPYLLRLIDLSSNRFEGEIPAGIIGKLRGLHFLNLSNNTLNGLIPSSVGNLTALELLELSENQLSKSILSNLAQHNFLAYFNVSHNHLMGPIPLGQQFNTFQEDSYQGNSSVKEM